MTRQLRVGDELRAEGARGVYYGLVLYVNYTEDLLRVRVRKDGPDGPKLADVALSATLTTSTEFAVLCDSLHEDSSVWTMDLDWDERDYKLMEQLLRPSGEAL